MQDPYFNGRAYDFFGVHYAKPRTSRPVGTSPRNVGGVNGSQLGAAPAQRVVPGASATRAQAKTVTSPNESLPLKRAGA
jgi:hypothetical protein